MKREELEAIINDDRSTEMTKIAAEMALKDLKIEELEMTLACYEDEVHQLRKQLEDVQKAMATENVDLGMENFKLKERIKDLNAEIIAKDMAGAELVNENRELKKQVEKLEARIFNEKDLRKRACHDWAKAKDRIKELRVEMLIAKAGFFAELKHNGDYLLTMANDNKSWEESEMQLERISRAYEARAKRIKKGM